MRRQLAGVAAVITVLVIAAFAIPLGLLVQSVAHDRATNDVGRDATALAPVLALTSEPRLIEAAVRRTTTGASGRMAVVLSDGTVVGPADRLDLSVVDRAAARQEAFEQHRDGGVDVAVPILTTSNDVAVVVGRADREQLHRGVNRAWAVLALVGATLVLAAVAIADRLARSITAPTAALAVAARRLAGGELDTRARPEGPPEVAEVARAFNGLARRQRGLLAAERERVADLSHRLRTPLMALRLDAEAAGDPTLVDHVDRLERAVSNLITDARRPLTRKVGGSCDLVEVAAERTEFWGALAAEQDRPWAFDGTGSITIEVEADEVADALDAVLGNVFEHTPHGVECRVSVRREGDRACVCVDDRGPGLGGLDAVRRGTSGGSGTGLGLDIAQRTAESVGGSLQLSASPRGGARVELWFPVADAR